MRPELFTIERAGPGRLSTMARPRGGDWLADEIAGLAGSGVTVLVSLLTIRQPCVYGLAFSPDGKTLFTGDFNGNTYLWDLATKHIIATLPIPDNRWIRSIALSPDGKTLAAGYFNGLTYCGISLPSRRRRS